MNQQADKLESTGGGISRKKFLGLGALLGTAFFSGIFRKPAQAQTTELPAENKKRLANIYQDIVKKGKK